MDKEIIEALELAPYLPEPTEEEIENMAREDEIYRSVNHCLAKLIIDYAHYHKNIWICPICRTVNKGAYLGQVGKCSCGSKFEIHLLSSTPYR